MDKNGGDNGSSRKAGAEKEAEMERLKTAVHEQLARFRPPFTPSNSLLRQQSPPAIKVTRAPAQSSQQLEAPKEEEAQQIEAEEQSQTPTTETMPRPPQPFPLPLRRRSSTSNTPSPNPSPAYRHSMPRLSITSLGSVAKTFRTLAAFIVPEVPDERERHRELHRASQRRASLAAVKMASANGERKPPTTTVDEKRQKMARAKSIREGREKSPQNNDSKVNSVLMRSSSARPLPRTQQRSTPIPRQQQNGAAPQQGREASRSRSAAGHQQLNGGGRAPSMPPIPRIVNKRYAHVKSKVGSITDYQPAPTAVKIFHQPVKVAASPKVGSLQNASHIPAGGNVKIEQRKLTFREAAKPRVDAKSEVPIPKSDKKIPTQKLVWNAEAKVGSLELAKHRPGGGDIKIFNEPVKVKADSKVGSLNNIGHVPGGGNVKISDYSHSISGTGSIRSNSRRDTVDSGRSSSQASGTAGIQQQASKDTMPSNSREQQQHWESVPQRQPQMEILITPRELPDDGGGRQLTNGQQQHNNDVAEAELINFG